MAKLTRKTGRPSMSSRTGSSSRRPISSAPKKQHTYSPKTARTKPVGRGVNTTAVKRTSYKTSGGARSGRSMSRFSLWMKILRALMIRHRVAIIIVVCVLLVLGGGAFTYFKFFAGKTQTVDETIPEETRLTEEHDPLAEDYTQEELDGLSGKNLDTSNEEYADILDSGRVFIGVTIGEPSEYEKKLVQKLEEAINEEYQNGTVGDCVPYDSNGDINQQIQDVRSLVNIGAKAVIVCSTSVDEYIVITDMAQEKDIKVVAVNAPIDRGYDINIVADDQDFGFANATFIGNNLEKGNIVQFIDTAESSGNAKRLEAFNTKIAEFPNVKVNAMVNMSEISSAKKAYDSIKEEGTIEAIYTESGYALDILNEVIKRDAIPKVFIGDATAGFIKKWHELVTTGVKIEKVDEDDDDIKIEVLVEAPSMKVFVRPAPYGVAATAVKFAIRLAEGKALKPDMLSSNKTYYYTGSIAIVESMLPYYVELVKDREDDFVINDWPTDYEVDQYFDGAGRSYYDTTPLRLTKPPVTEIEAPTESADDGENADATDDGEKKPAASDDATE